MLHITAASEQQLCTVCVSVIACTITIQVIGNRLSDIIIVGRGIYQTDDPADAARKYQEAGYGAYFPRD